MKKRILALILAVVATLNVCPISAVDSVLEEPTEILSAPSETENHTAAETASENGEALVSGLVKLTCDSSDNSRIVIGKGKKAYVHAILDDTINHIGIYRWQIKTSSGQWATIRDYVLPYAVVSEALVAGMIDEGGKAYLRCLAVDGDVKYVSEAFEILLNSSIAPEAIEILPPIVTEDYNKPETIYEAEAIDEPIFAPLSVTHAPTMMLLSEISTESEPEEITAEPEVTEEPEVIDETEETVEPTAPETIEEEITEAEPIEDETTAPPRVEAFHIVINYTFRHATQAPLVDIDKTPAANTFTVTLTQGGHYSGTVASPPEVGYLPYVKLADAKYVSAYKDMDIDDIPFVEYDGEEYVLAYSVEFLEVSTETTLNVYYIPQFVNFQVKIYEQNLYNDEYSLVSTEMISTKRANETVGEGHAKPRDGFSPLFYDPNVPVSEDGSTVVEIYYDRNYYLVEFDLKDTAKAFGAPPCLVRYNSQVVMPSPTRTGFAFNNWSLTRVYLTETQIVDGVEQQIVTEVTNHSYATLKRAGEYITVKHNLKYEASWNLASTTYELVYWLENADSTDASKEENYDVWYIYNVPAKTDDKTIAGGDHIKTYVTTKNGFTQSNVNDVTNTYPYVTLNTTLTESFEKTVVGDGTTAVNVYYQRNEYTLKFYYAIEKVANQNRTYHVIGGSTYYFGSYASGNAQTDEIAAMRQYASGGQVGNTGLVTALPTLNDTGLARVNDGKYIQAFDTEKSGNTTYNYHYISFVAKFGADITNLWPCDVFNSAERSTNNTHGQWSGKQAFVSAWNGEYRVKYTQNSSNQTIKGKYTQLDANLLWNNTSITDTTVAYACFWENGANINWSVPELYRYNIYLPVLDGESYDDKETTVYNGKTYYLADRYNTCDDSNVHSQTQPGLVGFTANGRASATITDFDRTVYKEAYDMFFYYDRNLYNLTFNDMHGSSVTIALPYDILIANDNDPDHAHNHDPAYPDDLEVGEAKFVDWFLDKLGLYRFDHNMRMPAKNLQVYAKWETLKYTVRVFLDKEQMTLNSAPIYTETVEFDNFVEEPNYRDYQKDGDNNKYKDLIYAGWYYMDGSEEKRFDFNTMTLKENLDIYAKWTSRVPVEYVIYYVIQVGDEYINIAEPTEGASLVGMNKSFIAKVGKELFEDYRTGFYPEMRSHSMTMGSTDENVYRFIYTYVNDKDLDYSVTHTFISNEFKNTVLNTNSLHEVFHYIISGEEASQRAANVVVSFREGVTKSAIGQAAYDQIYYPDEVEAGMETLAAYGITRDAVALAAEAQTGGSLSPNDIDAIWNIVTKLSPNFYEQNLRLTTAQENNVTFEWGDHGSTAYYQVILYEQSVDGTDYVAFSNQTHTASIGTTVSMSDEQYNALKNQYSGFTLITPQDDLTGVVQKVTISSTGDAAEGLIWRLYYDRNVYEYKIHHYIEGTTTRVAPDDTGSAPYKTLINAFDVFKLVDGYTAFNSNAIFEVSIKDSNNTSSNEFVCYYRGLTVDFLYQILGGVGGTLTHNSDTSTVGTPPKNPVGLTVNTGFFLNEWKYSVGEGELQAVPEEWLSSNKMTLQITETDPEWASKTVYVYAEILPETRIFEVFGSDAQTQKGSHSFLFNIKGKSGTETEHINVSFVIIGNGSVQLERLPYGDYTLTALGWAWRYGLPSVTIGKDHYPATESGAVEITLNDASKVVFNYSAVMDDPTRNKWLTDNEVRSLHLEHAE